MANVLQVMVVEDQRLVREAISALIDLDDRFEVISQQENGALAIEALEHSKRQDQCFPDIILSDIEMPELSGIEMAEQLQSMGIEIDIVIMTTFSKPGYIKRAMQAGVKGFILKESHTDYLLDSLQKVADGERIIEPELALMALDDKDPLTNKERKALSFGMEGLSTQEIADKMFLSVGTVRNYLSEAISKLDASNRVDAARIAKQKGWL